MVCKKAPGKIARHQVLNDVIWRALNAAGIPTTKEPSGINRQATAATGMGLVADQTASRKSAKYVDFTAAYIFQPIAVQNLGPINASALDFIRNLGQNISYLSGDDREAQFLFQRISVTIQRFNSVLLHDSFGIHCPDQ